jgi:spore coat protein U-like protein
MCALEWAVDLGEGQVAGWLKLLTKQLALLLRLMALCACLTQHQNLQINTSLCNQMSHVMHLTMNIYIYMICMYAYVYNLNWKAHAPVPVPVNEQNNEIILDLRWN